MFQITRLAVDGLVKIVSDRDTYNNRKYHWQEQIYALGCFKHDNCKTVGLTCVSSKHSSCTYNHELVSDCILWEHQQYYVLI